MEWTRWYDWDKSSEDWDAGTKIKHWSFATSGLKEVWAEVKDVIGQTASSSATISVLTAFKDICDEWTACANIEFGT